MRLFGFICIILALYKIALANLQDGLVFKTSMCDGKNGALMPIFGTCQKYYICNNGSAIVETCGMNKLFNPSTLHCEDSALVDCIFDSSEEEDDEDSESESEEDEEPTTTKRIPTTQPPKRPAAQTQLSVACLHKKRGYKFAKIDSCSDYYVCISKRAQLRHCSKQQHFSASQRTCMKPEKAKCSLATDQQIVEEFKSKPAVTAGVCTGEKEDALVPHKEDCGKFYHCSNMMFLVMDCPTGLHFNPGTKRCDYAKIANCEINSNKNDKKKTRKNSKRKVLKM